MKKYLLAPIDFSENALDAAGYALSLLSQIHAEGLILYHSNPTQSLLNDIVLKELGAIKAMLEKNTDAAITCVTDNHKLADGINALITQYGVSLIVMGITGRNKTGQKLIGSSVFEVSEHVDVPVLVVPAKSRFTEIDNIALALPIIPDLAAQIPYSDIKTFIKGLDAKLMVINVGSVRDKIAKPVLYAALKDIFELFDELSPAYHFPTAANTADSIASFARDNHAQLLISIAGKYGFLQEMFHPSVTKKLAYHSTVPLLIYRSGVVA